MSSNQEEEHSRQRNSTYKGPEEGKGSGGEPKGQEGMGLDQAGSLSHGKETEFYSRWEGSDRF